MFSDASDKCRKRPRALNVSWNEGKCVSVIVSYRSGPWEKTFERAVRWRRRCAPIVRASAGKPTREVVRKYFRHYGIEIMDTRVRTKRVRLIAVTSIELEPGVVMQPGNYTGVSKELGVAMTRRQMKWTPPEYTVLFSGEQLTKMGMRHVMNVISIDYDVTEFVRLGQISGFSARIPHEAN